MDDDPLEHRLEQTEPFEGIGQEAVLSLLAASSAVRNRIDEVCEEHDILTSQYNILRILAGGPPDGYPRRAVIEHMVNRGPDVTRLADDLEERGLVERRRAESDRRKTMHRITEKGRRVLYAVTTDLAKVRKPLDKSFSDQELKQFIRLCAGIYRQFD